jgi:Lar family restriction alleviation protein
MEGGATMTDKLKPCPFCGGDNVDVFNWEVTFQGDYFKAYCKDCDFELKPQRTEEEAIKAWNTRKPMDRIVERLERIAYETADWMCGGTMKAVELTDAIAIVKGGAE